MQNQNNKYKPLIEEVCSMLGLTYQELKDKYRDYPICLMEYIEGNANERVIEVRFDSQEATVSISFDKEDICNASFLFFDNEADEDSFIACLIEDNDYDFKRSCWIADNCYLKAKPSKYGMAFYFYR